jgi:hypothetical protein
VCDAVRLQSTMCAMSEMQCVPSSHKTYPCQHKPIQPVSVCVELCSPFKYQNTAYEELSTVLLTYPYLDLPRDKTINSNFFKFSTRGSGRFQSSGMLRRAACLTLKMKTVCSFETSSVNTCIYQSTRRNISKCLKILSEDISVKITKCATLTFISPLFIKRDQTE